MPQNCLSHDEQSLLAVVRAALNGGDDRLGNCQMDYRELMRMAEEQAVQGLLLDGIAKLPKETAPPLPMLLRLTGVVCQQMENINRLHIDVIGKIAATLDDAGIKAVFMKGQTTGRRWPAPLHRTPGDIDFLVGKEDYLRTLDVLEGIGRVDRALRHDTIWHKLRNYRWVAGRAWRMGFVCPSEALWWPVSKIIRFTKK